MQGQMRLPVLSKSNKIFIGLYVGVFLISQVFKANGVNLLGILGLSTGGVKSGMIFQFLTFPLIETSFMSVVFNSILIWFIGSDLENKWGTWFYFKIMVLASLVSGIGYVIISAFAGGMTGFLPLYGLTGIVLTLLVAYGIIYSERQMLFMMIFPIKAKYFCMILGAIELYMALFSNYSNAAWAHLLAMLSGFVYLKLKSLRAQGVTMASVKRDREKQKMKQRLRIVGDEEPAPKANKDEPKFWQ